MKVLQRRLLALVHRATSWSVSVRWILLGSALAIVGVVQLEVAIPAAVNIGLALVSAALVALDVGNHRRTQRATRFTPRPTDGFADLREALVDNPRFTILDFQGGTFLHDKAASIGFAGTATTAHLRASDYVLPLEFRNLGRLYQRRHVRGNTHAYNDPVLGLDTDLGFEAGQIPTTVTVVGSRYWDYLASDVFAGHEVTVEDRHRPDLGRRLVIDRRGMVRDFGQSWLLNAIGVSVLAITTDGFYIAVTQSQRNDSARGQYAPTGSGSLEPKDLRGAPSLPFVELCANGALREAGEEAGIRESEVTSLQVLGFGRWLEKAAKPEVLMLALVSIDSHEVKRREVPRADRAFTLAAEPCRFVGPPIDWRPTDIATMADQRVCSALAVPLAASFVLLAEAVRAQARLRAELLNRGCGR